MAEDSEHQVRQNRQDANPEDLDTASRMAEPGVRLYRMEAVEHHRAGRGSQGRILMISSEWTLRTYPALIVVVLIGLCFLGIAQISEDAVGTAIVHAEDLVYVTPANSGVVSRVLISPGQVVSLGEALLEFDRLQESEDLSGYRSDMDHRLQLDALFGPNSDNDQAIARLRASISEAVRRLDHRVLRAPAPGFVSDIRVRSGQIVQPGEAAVVLLGANSRFSLVAVFDGTYRPQLAPGMELRVKWGDRELGIERFRIRSVKDQVLGPAEVRRSLGREIGDAVPFSGSAALVSADIVSASYEVRGVKYRRYDGMLGTAEVRVSSKPALLALLTGMK